MKKIFLTAVTTFLVTSFVLGQSALLTAQGVEVSKFTLAASSVLLLSVGVKDLYSWINLGFDIDLKGINL